MANRPDRPVLAQRFTALALPATVAAQSISSISQQFSISQLITGFCLSTPVGAQNCILGDATVSTALGNGLWITPGVPILLTIGDQRQVYEVQMPLLDIGKCADGLAIPFTSFDFSQWYVAAAAPQTIGLLVFYETYK